MANCDGSIVIGVEVDGDKARVEIQNLTDGIEESGSKLSGVADKLKTGLATAAKVGAAAIGAASAGMVALTRQAIDGYAEYEQLVGGVETLFGDSNTKVLKYANDAFKTAGLSANEYMETVTSFSASLLQGLGGDTAKAAEIADLAITDMADNANKMGTDMESIQNAYQGFAKQNYTMLDNLKLGYGVTQEEMIRLINDSGILNETISDLDNVTFDQMIEAIHAVQTNMGITGTTAKEASTTIQGSIASMKSAWTNFLTGMADPEQEFEDLLENLIGSVVTVGENIIPRIQALLPRLVSGLTELLQNLIHYIPETLNTLLPTLIDGATALINGFTTVLPDIITAAVQAIPQLVDAAVSIVGNLISALIEAAPQILAAGVQLLDQLVTGIETGLPDMISRLPQIIDGFLNYITENLPSVLEKGVEILNSLVNGILEAIPQFLSKLPEIITSFVTFIGDNLPQIVEAGVDILLNLAIGFLKAIPEMVTKLPEIITAIVNGIANLWPKIIKAGVNIVLKVWDGMLNAIPELVKNVPKIVTAIIDGIKAQMSGIINIGKNIVEGVWSGISSMATWIKDKVTGLFSGVVDGVKDLLGIASPSKVFASIGGFMAEGLAQGVENGMDLAVNAAQEMSNAVERAARPNIIGNISLPFIPSIPSIATGAVIPANGEFFSVVNRQPAATTNDSGIRKNDNDYTALLQAILSAIRSGKVMVVDKKVLAHVAVQGINDLTMQAGKSVLKL